MTSDKTIPPGGEGEIKATLSTKGRTGPLKKTITVMSNDPDNPRLTLTLEGEVVTDVALKPPRLSLGEVTKGEAATREFTATVAEPEKVSITAVTVDDDRFEVQAKDGAAGTYEVRFKGSDEFGRITAKVTLALKGADNPTLELPIWGEVVSDLRYPKSTSLYRKDGEFAPQRVRLSSRSGKDVKITSVVDEGKALKTELEQAEGKTAVVVLTVVDKDKETDQPVRGKLLIKTTDPDEPEVTVSYVIQYRDLKSPRQMGPLPTLKKELLKLPNKH